MRVFKTKEFLFWLVINILTPVLAPFVIIQWRKIEMPIDLNVCEIFEMFGKTGAYIFFSLYVLVSLLPHFFSNIAPNKVELYQKIGRIYALVVFLVVCVTSSFYMTYLGFSNSLRPFNLLSSVIVTILGVLIAIFFKVIFLLEKKTIMINIKFFISNN